MKKCIVMFVFLILAIVMSKLADRHDKTIMERNYALNGPHAKVLLAKAQAAD